MSKDLFIQTDEQRQWLKKLETIADSVKKHAQQTDEEAVFPFENFKKLRDIGYTKMTLPKNMVVMVLQYTMQCYYTKHYRAIAAVLV